MHTQWIWDSHTKIHDTGTKTTSLNNRNVMWSMKRDLNSVEFFSQKWHHLKVGLRNILKKIKWIGWIVGEIQQFEVRIEKYHILRKTSLKSYDRTCSKKNVSRLLLNQWRWNLDMFFDQLLPTRQFFFCNMMHDSWVIGRKRKQWQKKTKNKRKINYSRSTQPIGMKFGYVLWSPVTYPSIFFFVIWCTIRE